MRRQDARENSYPTQDLRKAVTGSKIVMCRETRGGAKGTRRSEKLPPPLPSSRGSVSGHLATNKIKCQGLHLQNLYMYY